MENKIVGYIIFGISAIVIGVVFLFRSALKEIVTASCTLQHGGTICPMYVTINQQTYLALAIVGILVIFGFILIFSKPEEKIIVKKIKENKKKFETSELKPEEKKVFSLIQENKAIFQADLIEKTGFGKAKITRILDRLEGKSFIERKRRGLTNVVVLKEN